jgi:hypothetical protein
VREAELGQLPVEPRDFFDPLLEGRLRPLECGALLPESDLGLFPCQALTLDGSPSLSEGGSLLLKLSALLLARILLPLEPLFRRDEVALSARLVLSSSASLAFSSAWLRQDRAPSRVAWSR